MSAFEGDPNMQKIHLILQRLWTKAVGTEDYIKKEWLELEKSICIMSKDGVKR